MFYSYIDKFIIFLKNNWIQILLIILSIYDLRVDLRLLIDFFTFSSLFYTFFEHPLALTVLITMPTFFNSSIKKKTKEI